MKTIYTLGGDSMDWREDAEKLIKSATSNSVGFVHPPMYRMAMNELIEWAVFKLSESDIVLLNLDELSGIEFELFLVSTMNIIRDRKIFVVAYGSRTDYPKYSKIVFHSCDTLEDAVDYITCNFLE